MTGDQPELYFASYDLTFGLAFVTLDVPVKTLNRPQGLHHLQLVVPNREQQGGEAVVVAEVDIDILDPTESLDYGDVSEEASLQ